MNHQSSFETSPLVARSNSVCSDTWDKAGEMAQVAGYIKRIDMRNFPTEAHGNQTIMLSPNRQKTTILSGDATMLLAAVEAVLGVPLWRLSCKQGNRRVHSDNAMVRLTFWNEGPKAFEPNVYGRQIIVERSFACFGASVQCNVLRMANEKGSIVSSAAGTLDRMLQHFQIRLEHPLFRVDEDHMFRALQAHPETLHWMFLQAHELDGWELQADDLEGWNEPERLSKNPLKQLQAKITLLQKARVAKVKERRKLREEAWDLRGQLENLDSSVAELTQCFNLASYQNHKKECAKKREFLSQAQQLHEGAMARVTIVNGLQKMRTMDEVSSSLGAHSSMLKELEEKLKCTMEKKDMLEEDLHQVQADKRTLADEAVKLELASRLARKGVGRERKQKALTTNKKGSKAEASLHLAMNFSREALVSDHRKACKQASQLRRKERKLINKVSSLQATIQEYDADIDKYNVLAEGCRKEISQVKAASSKIKTEIGEDALQAFEKTCAELKAAIDLLETKSSEAMLAAKDCELSKGTWDSDDSNVDDKLMLLLEQGVALGDPDEYDCSKKKTELTNAHRNTLRQVEQLSQDIRKSNAREENAQEEYKLLRRKVLDEKSRATEKWFQFFVRGINGTGSLEFDHENGKVYLSGFVPSNAMFWHQAFLFALLGSSEISSCVLNCEDSVAAVYRPFLLHSVISNAMQLHCQSLIIATSDEFAAGYDHSRNDGSIHVVKLPD